MSTFDASIPVLTEVFQDQPVKPAPPGSGPADLPPLSDVAEAEVELQPLEKRIADRILLQLQPHIEWIVAEAVAQELAHPQSPQK